jgi:hypothetical protein
MPAPCAANHCAEAAVASFDDRAVCRAHFLASAYGHLESIASQIHEANFHENNDESAARCLEQCMREATNIACGAEPPENLERAQLLDILLWASELYGCLRRGPRVRARIPIWVRCEAPEGPWEEKSETHMLSTHGFSFLCRHELSKDQVLTCVRLDTGRRLDARVVWVRGKESGEIEAGLEFLKRDDFWGFESGAGVAAFPSISTVKPIARR